MLEDYSLHKVLTRRYHASKNPISLNAYYILGHSDPNVTAVYLKTDLAFKRIDTFFTENNLSEKTVSKEL